MPNGELRFGYADASTGTFLVSERYSFAGDTELQPQWTLGFGGEFGRLYVDEPVYPT